MRRLLLPLVTLSLAFAPAPFPRPDSPKDDLKKMQGTWERVALTIGGAAHPEAPGQITIVITGTHLQFPSPQDAWTITLDAGKKPRHFDYRGAAPPVQKITFRGIYRLEGDTLTICCVESARGEDRPTKFESLGGQVWLQVYKRKKR
jgi:uncharacterized protein (TIGR03067 family)